jgi:hypothetical protein
MTQHRALGGLDVSRLGHHFHVRLRRQQHAEAIADDRVIVREDDRDLRRAVVHGRPIIRHVNSGPAPVRNAALADTNTVSAHG